jgi:hypothetical protein
VGWPVPRPTSTLRYSTRRAADRAQQETHATKQRGSAPVVLGTSGRDHSAGLVGWLEYYLVEVAVRLVTVGSLVVSDNRNPAGSSG